MSAPVIKVRTISAVSEAATQVTNGLWARSVGLPAGWSKLRVGIRLHVTNAGGLTAGTTFAMGLCSGLTNVFGDLTTTHFAGLYSPDTSGFNGSGFYGWSMVAAKKVGSTLTQSGALNTAFIGAGAASATADITLMFVDITKGSPNYTFQGFYDVTNAVPGNSTNSDFLTQMVTATPSKSQHAQTSAVTIAVDEATNGVFDSVNVYYSTLLNILEVCDIGVVQLA